MTPFHFTIDKKSREGVHHLRIYSVPTTTAVQLVDHWKWLAANAKAVTLPGPIVIAMDPIDIQSENEIEQGVPRYSERKFDFASAPELIPLIQAARDSDMEIWIEDVLEQPLLDAPLVPANGAGSGTGASITWPFKKKNIFWGQMDRKTLKGKVSSQKIDTSHPVAPNDYIRATKSHNGSIEMSFTHWMKCIKTTPKTFLDATALSSGTQTAAAFTYWLLKAIVPTNGLFYLADHRLKAQLPSFFLTLKIDSTIWGDTPIELSVDNVTWWKNLNDVYFQWGSGPLWLDDPAGSNEGSFYHWSDLAQALTEWSREFFFTTQIEIPTMEAAAAAPPLNFGFAPPDSAAGFEGYTRVLTLPLTECPLPIYLDVDEDSLEYDLCGAWASSYKVDEPAGEDLFPFPPSASAKSKFAGGADQSYKTLFRLIGQSYVNGVLTDDQRGWELKVKDSGGVLKNARYAESLTSSLQTDWAAIHAYLKIDRWGTVRAIVTCAARSIALEPCGTSVTVGGKPIVLPKQTFGINDFGDFPLQRSIVLMPGIFSSPDDTPLEKSGIVDARTYIVLGIKRTPDGDMEVKLLEFEPAQFSSAGDVLVIAPPPPPPPPPNGPTDPPTLNITGT